MWEIYAACNGNHTKSCYYKCLYVALSRIRLVRLAREGGANGQVAKFKDKNKKGNLVKNLLLIASLLRFFLL